MNRGPQSVASMLQWPLLVNRFSLVAEKLHPDSLSHANDNGEVKKDLSPSVSAFKEKIDQISANRAPKSVVDVAKSNFLGYKES